MIVVDIATGKSHQVDIEPVEIGDYIDISKNRYFFNWTDERDQEVYKLNIVGTNDILGLVSLERIPKEWRIHIRLLTVSKENKGSDKKYENIAGNLITFVSKIAVREYAELACVSLKPKGVIAQHYIDKFGMNITGMTLSVEIPEILNLINTYDHD
ncbi:MAG: N-acetyltransferase [Flavobacteriales bacterium]|nr:N-acetyltransferase [Flavobacteriales bacterium]